MGLLDYDFSKALNSDQGRLGLGLLAAAAPSNQGFGQRLLSALGYVQGQQDRDAQKQMQQFQMQDLIAQTAARKREAEKQAKADKEESDIQAFSKNFYKPEIKPEIYADGTQMGPAQPGSFDMQSMLKQLPGAGVISPLKAIEYAQKFAKANDLPLNKVDIDKFTPSSIAKFTQTRNYSDLIPAAQEDKSPTKVQEYEYAKKQGYKGSLADWVAIAPTITANAIAPLREAQVKNIQDENDYNLPAPRPKTSGVTVQTPDGRVFSFPNQSAANSFKMKAGIK